MGSIQRARVVYAIPAVICLYGESGYGKSVDTLYSFPRGFFVAEKGSLKPAFPVVGYIPIEIADTENIDTATVLLKAKIAPRSGTFDAVIFDDFGRLVLAQRDVMAKTIKDGRQLYGALMIKVIEFVDLCRDTLRCHAVFNCHIRRPDPPDLPYGGPKLPGSIMGELPKICDMVLRVDPDPMRRPWPACYRAGLWAGPEWISKDRHHVVIDRAPMNLAEILRAAGYTVRRPPGFEWMEDAVSYAANAILGGQPEYSVFTQATKLMVDMGAPVKAIDWVLRDARDRVELLAKRRTSTRTGFGVTAY